MTALELDFCATEASAPEVAPGSLVVSCGDPRVIGGPGFWLREHQRVVSVRFVAPAGAAGRVVRLSPTTLWIVADEGLTEQDLPAEAQVFLVVPGGEIGPLSAEIAPDHSVDGPFIALRLTHVPLSDARRMLAVLEQLVRDHVAEPARRLAPVVEEISNGDRIGAVARALAAAGGVGLLRSADMAERDAPLPVRLVRVDGASLLWTGREHWGQGPYAIEVHGYNSLYRLHVAGALPAEGAVRTPLPQRVERVRHRWFRRSRGRLALHVEVRHPIWRELPPVRRRIRDVSIGGICFETNLEEDLVFPGLELPLLRVEDVGGVEVCLRGEVRAVLPGEGGEPALCRVSVVPASREEEAAWLALVSTALYTTTCSGVDWTESLWDLFETSGYFSLSGKTPEEFDALKRSFVEATRRAADAPQLFCQAVWPSTRGIEATVSVLKAYRGTWLGHQLAKRAGTPPEGTDPRQILRDVYFRAHEHAQADAGFRWLIGYVEATVPWMRKAHVELARRYAATGLALVLPFQLMEAEGAGSVGSRWADVTVGEATPEEKGRLVRAIGLSRPRGYVESLDFVAERLELTDVSQAWAAAGFERKRTVLVARRNREALAAAVLETGELGTSLFRLLDSVRLFPLAPLGETGFAPLIEAARHWYLARGKPSFVYYREHQSEEHTRDLGLRDLGQGHLWIIAAALLPDFLEHVYELTAPRRAIAPAPQPPQTP